LLGANRQNIRQSDCGAGHSRKNAAPRRHDHPPESFYALPRD
jgi:hypothetical protein